MLYKEKAYTRINWKNRPNLSTPLGAKNLNKMDETINELDNRIIEISSEVEKDRLNISLVSGELNALKEDVEENTLQIKEISSLAEDVNGLKIVNTASGTTAYMDDASNMNIENIVFYGESKQLQTTGKNLLNANGLTEQTISGVTFTPVYKNGLLEYVNVNGKCTASSTSQYVLNQALPLNDNAQYTLNGCPSGGSGTTFKVDCFYTGSSSFDDIGKGVTFTARKGEGLRFRIVVFSGATLNNVKFYPMIRLASITDGTYEPYTGGKPAPNPDYPQSIDGSAVRSVSVRGKNSLDSSRYTTKTSNGITFTPKFDSNGHLEYITANGTATAKTYYALTDNIVDVPTESLILNGCKGGSANTYSLLASYRKEDGTTFTKEAYQTDADLPIDTAEKKYMITIYINSGVTVSNVKFYPMLRPTFFTDSAYEPYQSQTASLVSGTYRLDGIRDSKNYYDAKRGVYGEKVKRIVLNGSETWVKHDEQYPHLFRTYLQTSAKGLKSVLCSHFPYDTGNLMSGLDGCRFRNEEISVVFYISSSKHTDVSAFKSWLASNPVTLVYELAEPEEGKLLSSIRAEFAEFLKLHPYKPNTIVDAQDTLIDVQYVADTKAYIDNKFRELATAIVNQ